MVYQEITLIPNDDIPPYAIWSKLYNQLHIGLADVANEHGINTIGVAFPDYRYSERYDKGTLGSRLRVFAPSCDELEKLDLPLRLSRLSDYVHIKAIADVGERATGHVVVERYRHYDLGKQVERFAEFKNLTVEQALEHCLAHKKKAKNYPFVRLDSETNQRHYHLYIRQYTVAKPQTGVFNTYGINNINDESKASVPHW